MRVRLWQTGACRTRVHLCSTETRKRTRGTKKGSFVNFKGLAAAEEITGVFFFPFLRFLPFGEAGIAVSKAAARKSKTKVSFFSLEGPGYGTATIHSLPSLPTPFFSYHHPLRHRLLLSPPFLLLPLLTVAAVSATPNPFSCSMYYLWP